MHVETQVALSVLYRLQRDSLNVTDRPKVELDYEITGVDQSSSDGLQSFSVRYNSLNWNALCDLSGISTGEGQICSWQDIISMPHLDAADLQRFLYHDRSCLVTVRLGTANDWCNMHAPGWFVLHLYEAMRKSFIHSGK